MAENPTEYRRKTRSVRIGNVCIGANHPIAVQSMTNTDTRDIEKTVEQILQLANAGADIVRMSVQGKKEAFAMEKIKNQLWRQNCTIPLVADIHFYPPAALVAAEFVDKIRINPGNFADPRAQFKKRYTKEEFLEGKKRIAKKLVPLILLCKKNNIALRIGTNHGSLSDRMMNVYGDTTNGMVASAMEFATICREYDYHDLVFSMKSSNPILMIEAYRKLVEEMQKRNWDYPLHLGVTEAGANQEGRIKSWMGMGSLLLEGIGDTIRMSLTENPVAEIAPAKQLVRYCAEKIRVKKPVPFTVYQQEVKKRLETNSCSLIVPISLEEVEQENIFSLLGLKNKGDGLQKSLATPDGIFLPHFPKNDENLRKLAKAQIAIYAPVAEPTNIRFAKSDVSEKPQYFTRLFSEETKQQFFLSLDHPNIETALEDIAGCDSVILYGRYPSRQASLQASVDIGSFLCARKAQGICVDAHLPIAERIALGTRILQAARLRFFTTEFISCPGCGRTLFDLEEVTKKIRKKTGHLPGVKIAVMGCIVNGPGEMADADFGYVGTRPGKIDLYVGKNPVKKNIDFAFAEQELVDLLKSHGKWVEPSLQEMD